MNVYDHAGLAALIGVGVHELGSAIAKTRVATMQSPTMHELRVPVEAGERRPLKIVAEMLGGFVLFPTLPSARIAYRERAWIEPQKVTARAVEEQKGTC